MTEEMDVTIHRVGQPEQVSTLTMPVLGMRPYVLIELGPASDGSGDPAVFASAGGGAEEDIAMLPVVFVTSLPVDRNPISRELIRLRDSLPDVGQSPEAVIAAVAEALGVPMSEGGQ